MGEGTEEEVGFLDAARRKGAGVAARIVEPGERKGTEFGLNFRKGVVDGQGLAISTDQKTVGTEGLGLGIASAKDAGVETLSLVAGGEFLARGDALGVVWGRIEVEGADLVEIEHGRSACGRVAAAYLPLDEALDDGKEIGGFTGVGSVKERSGIADDGGLVKLAEAA